jgi:hypothetical protein
MLYRTLVSVLGGAGLGATAAAVYAVLCTSLYWLITHKGDPREPLLIRFVTSGAAAGAIVGLCLAIDRATRRRSMGRYGHPGEKRVDGGRPNKKQLVAYLTTNGMLSGGAPSLKQPCAKLPSLW